MKNCLQCKNSFEVNNQDREFYKKVSPIFNDVVYEIPEPTLCPTCRCARRLSYRNERSLYHRKCDFSGKPIISIYSPDKPYKVYENAVWWSDQWDSLSYGRDFNFNRPFFEQFRDLQLVVPRMGMIQSQNENSDYTNCVSHLKNCYLLFSADFNQDCAYGTWIERSKDCYDNLMIEECERCYDCFFTLKSFNSRNIYFSSQCSDSAFLIDCRNCSNCFMSYGLRNKQYCISNIQYSKDEYKAKMKEYPLNSNIFVEDCKKQFKEFLKTATFPHLWKHGSVENSTGDILSNVHNCQECYEIIRSKDCKYLLGAFDCKDVYDSNYVFGELGYENCESVQMPYRSSFNFGAYSGSNLLYCDTVMNDTRDCFGSISLKGGRYVILNKTYLKEDYEKLVPRIIEHMKKTKEYGEFFPTKLSPFVYNETEAQDYLPLTKEAVLANGWQWKDENTNENAYVGPQNTIPDLISDATDAIVGKIFICEETGKPYKITLQELRFYRESGIPLPHRCPDARRADLITWRNPRHLWNRACAQCGTAMRTTYAPERPERVVCETCYLKTIH